MKWLGLAAVAATGLTAATSPAHAAVSAPVVKDRVLTLTGDSGSDKLALRRQADDPDVLLIDRGDDGSGDFAVDRTTFDRIAIDAGPGNDAVRIDDVNGAFTTTQPATIEGGDGNDTLIGGRGAETLSGGADDDQLKGKQGKDVVRGGSEVDTVYWTDGDESDSVDGGADADLFLQTGSNAPETFTIEPAPTAGHVRVARDVGAVANDLVGVERLHLETFASADAVTASSASSTLIKLHIDAGDGNDRVTGADGSDSIVGGAGDDVLTGGAGDDNVMGGSGRDRLEGEAGDDILVGLGDSDVLLGGDGNDAIDWNDGDGNDLASGGNGADRFLMRGAQASETIRIGLGFSGGTVAVTRDLAAVSQLLSSVETVVVDANAGDDRITAPSLPTGLTALELHGSLGNDTITGGDGNDTLTGGPGNDTIAGAIGNDTVGGGDGNDTVAWNPGDGSDTVDGGAATDLFDMNGSSANDRISIEPAATAGHVRLLRDPAGVTNDLAGFETVDVDTFLGDDSVDAQELPRSLVATLDLDLGGDDDSARGGSGVTRIAGGLGDDILVGGRAPDRIDGGDGVDLLFGGAGGDTIHGNTGADFLFGNDGNDHLFGDAGLDHLRGDAGVDRLSCGGDADDLAPDPDDLVLPDCR